MRLSCDRLRADHPAVRHMGRSAFVPDGTPRDQLPSQLDHAVAHAPDWKLRDLRGTSLPVTKYCAQKTVTAEVDGEKRRVRRWDLLEPNDPLVAISAATPVTLNEE
jgi:hypothetical protein